MLERKLPRVQRDPSQPVSFRAGATRIFDLVQGSSAYYKSGANSFNTVLNLPNYIYRYTEPMTLSLSATRARANFVAPHGAAFCGAVFSGG